MVKRVIGLWVIILLAMPAVAIGKPLCSCPVMGTAPFRFNIELEAPPSLHSICKMAKELADADRLLKAGKRLAHDALRAFPYEPSLQASLQRLVVALNKFSERIEQLKRHATQVCPPRHLWW